MANSEATNVQPGGNSLMVSHPAYDSAPPSPQADATNELVFITYNGRQVVLGWSPSLEEAKATACQDLGLAERGYSGKDIAFLFHPSNDPSNPLIEVLASAWPRLRPLPHFQLIVRNAEDLSPPETALAHPAVQRTQAGHPRTLRTQASTLTNSGKSRQSRESDFASASNTDVSAGSGRVDIESWRRSQQGNFGAAIPPAEGYQNHITLPQHAMPSPPMSEVQSHRGASPCYDHSDPSSPSSHSSSRMQIDDNSARHVHGFGTDLDHQVESSKAGFLAETGRRTTVHFPHTLPASRPELLAPTPIRRSQSQELLNADYTNFKLDQSKQQQSKISQPQLNMGSTASNTHLPRTSVPKGPQVAREPNISHKTTRLARSYSNISPRVSNRSSANQSSRSSTLRQSWQSDELNANSSLARAPVDQDARITPPPAMQRSVSHSPLARSKVDCRSGISDLPSWSFPNRGQLDIFNGSSLTPQLGMPFSLPVDGNGSRRASLPELSNHSQTYVDWPSLSVRDTAWSRRLRADHVPTVPVPEVEMHDDSSDEGQEDQKYENNSTSVQISSTPKRSNSERTLRRLKSSPSGLADQYNKHYIPLDLPPASYTQSEAPGQLLISQLSASTKRGPTSWPNSPVKRNASLFVQNSPTLSNSILSDAAIPLCGSTSISKTKETKRKLLPPPPPLPSSHLEPSPDASFARTLLGSPIPPFLSDKRRPDSPLPPFYTHRSLPSSPQVLTVSRDPAHMLAKQTPILPKVEHGDSDPFTDPFRSLKSTQGQARTRPRLRSRSSQSAEDLYASANEAASTYSEYPPLPKVRSQLNLGTSGKSRRSRTH